MKALLLIFFLTNSVFAYEIYDARWCRDNGGQVQFDNEYNINFNCTTGSFNDIPYAKKLYNMLCIPYFSSILNNAPPQFLKISAGYENPKTGPFDDFNYKITDEELFRYI